MTTLPLLLRFVLSSNCITIIVYLKKLIKWYDQDGVKTVLGADFQNPATLRQKK